MRKVGLIGCGHVGATVALDIVQGGFADELVIIDKDCLIYTGSYRTN